MATLRRFTSNEGLTSGGAGKQQCTRKCSRVLGLLSYFGYKTRITDTVNEKGPPRSDGEQRRTTRYKTRDQLRLEYPQRRGHQSSKRFNRINASHSNESTIRQPKPLMLAAGPRAHGLRLFKSSAVFALIRLGTISLCVT